MARRASRRRGGATKVGTETGVRRTISAGLSRSPVSVAIWQPASAAMTIPAAMSWACSPRSVVACSRLAATNVCSQHALPRSRSRPGKRARVDGPQGVGADADVVLIVKFRGVVSMQPLAVEPRAGAFARPRTAR